MEMVVSGVSTRKIEEITYELCGATWQRCQTHFMRNILDKAPKALQKEIHAKVRAILDAPDAKTARMLLNQVLDEYRPKATKAMDVLEEGFEDAIAVLELPERYRKNFVQPIV